MKRYLFILFLFSNFLLTAQTFTLEECQQLARENYPVIQQRGLIDKLADYTVANARKNWLPQLSVALQATYQTDVMAFPDELVGMFPLDFDGLRKDQYKASVQIEQAIYEGGAVKAQVDRAKAEKEVSMQSWEVEMYNLQERVNQLYFGTLLLQEKMNEVDILIGELERNERLVQTYVINGVAGQNDLDLLRVEILSARQQRSDLEASQKAYRTMLGIMINKEFTATTTLAKPAMPSLHPQLSIERPELNYFDAQDRYLLTQQKGVNAQVRPRIGVFLQGAYANPGLNLFADMVENQWSPYLMGGIKFQWNISGYYTRKNDLSKIETGRMQLASQRETFLYNMNLKKTQESLAVERMQKVMREDDEIIRLRQAVRERTEVQVENGSRTVSDLLREMHAESLARQNKATHEIELLKNMYELKFTVNQ